MIDSWAWIEYFRGSSAGKAARVHIDGDEPGVISAINLAEVFRWFLKNQTAQHAEEARRIMVRRCAVRDVGASLAIEAARLRHREGWGLGDALVYATALATTARLVTGDPHFRDRPNVEFLTN